MRAAARDRSRVRAAAVDHAAGVDHRRAGRHLGVRDRVGGRRVLHHLLGGAQRTVGPAVAAGHEARGAVVAREVDERDHGRELQLDSVRARHVAPDGLVAVQPLLVGAGSALQQVADVELIARACGQQDAIGEREQQGCAHHVGRKGARDARDTRDLARLRAVERGQHRVEHRRLGIGRRDRGLDFVVDARDDVRVEQTFDDGGAVVADRRVDVVGMGVASEALQRCGHASVLREAGGRRRARSPGPRDPRGPDDPVPLQRDGQVTTLPDASVHVPECETPLPVWYVVVPS